MNQKDSLGILKGFALVAQIGLSIAIPLIFFVWFGQWIANRIGMAEAILLIVSIFLGLGVGFVIVWRLIYKAFK